MAAIVGTKADFALNPEGSSMRALLVAAIFAAFVWSLPADAAHWHVYPSFGFSYGVGP